VGLSCNPLEKGERMVRFVNDDIHVCGNIITFAHARLEKGQRLLAERWLFCDKRWLAQRSGGYLQV
jgi:hypothetical protein